MSLKASFFKLVEKERESLEKFGVKKIGLFGSCAIEAESAESDVDVLVEFDKKTFDNFIGLKFFLEEKIGRTIDLVTIDALKPALKDEILKEVKYAA